MSKQQKARFTVAEYLSMERTSSEKHEFAFGEIYAMGGASARHVGIVSNIVRELGNQLRQRPCQRVFDGFATLRRRGPALHLP